jgi:hypothetical protein
MPLRYIGWLGCIIRYISAVTAFAPPLHVCSAECLRQTDGGRNVGPVPLASTKRALASAQRSSAKSCRPFFVCCLTYSTLIFHSRFACHSS